MAISAEEYQSSDDDLTKEAKKTAPLFFSTFEVTRQSFHRTPPRQRHRQPQADRPRPHVRRPHYPVLSLQPLTGSLLCAAACGHMSICRRTDVLHAPVPRLADLRADELAELMRAVRRVGRVVERAYDANRLTIACQGCMCTVLVAPSWHRKMGVHQDRPAIDSPVHSDDVYPELEKQEGALSQDLASASYRSPEPVRMDADAENARRHGTGSQVARWLLRS
ncbi:hypothetical protein BJY52DRAFT_1224431 [Lactarius psammicola]|nr:hypothetical protein BJY52DRAFT_1224431 [Lactarius psammicola]